MRIKKEKGKKGKQKKERKKAEYVLFCEKI